MQLGMAIAIHKTCIFIIGRDPNIHMTPGRTAPVAIGGSRPRQASFCTKQFQSCFMQKLGSDIVAPLHVTCLGNLAALKLLLPPPPPCQRHWLNTLQ